MANYLATADSALFRKNVISNLERQGLLTKGRRGNKPVYTTNAKKTKIV